jgi:tetratricopeptide (TPR) repeat protein
VRGAAYDAHTRLIVKRARKLFRRDTRERTFALADGLHVLDEGIDNVNEEHRPELLQLRAEILEELGQEEGALDDLKRRAETGTNEERAKYHLVIARFLAHGPNPKRKNLRRAWSHISEACNLDPRSFPSQRLRAELFRQLHPKDPRQLNVYVRSAAELPEGRESYWLQYELGVTEFYVGRFREAAAAFSRLRRISRGSSQGLGVIEAAGERDGQDAEEFEGHVVRREDGRLAVECPELDEISPLWFNPRGERFYTARLRDAVSFLVAFNYRGALATDLKRL